MMRLIEHPSTELWDQVVSRSEYATFFHTSAWAHIIVETYPHFRIATKGFVLDDGTVAIVPLVAAAERNGFFKWCESMFPGGYGGAVAERNLIQAEIDYIFQHLTNAQTAYIHVMGNPYASQSPLPPSYSQLQQHTHVLDLTQGFDTVFSNYSRGKRKSTRKARHMGVEIGIATTEEEFKSYYEVYEDTLRRWGSNTLVSYPYRLFQQIYGCHSEDIRLWVARVEGKIVSGSLNFYSNQHVLAWHGATLESYFDYHPVPLLRTEIVKDACERGLRYYDFSPSGGLEGVENYKDLFGAERLPFYSYNWQSNRLYQAYQRLRRLGRSPLHESPLGHNGNSSQVAEVEPGDADRQPLP